MKTIRMLIIAVLSVLVLTAAFPHVVKAQDSDAIKQLLDSADYWRQRGRTDKAVSIWKKVLLSSPNHPTALSNLAMYYAQAGNKAQAEKYLNRLSSAHPGHPAIAGVQNILSKGPMQTSDLDQARALAKQGKRQEAVAKYRQAFGGPPPTVPLALEFYQTLGGTPGGWSEAKEGLEQLAASNPGSSRVKLALAKHYTYSEATRRKGIAQLQALSTDGQVGSSARAAWKQALLWLGASLADKPLYDAYLAAGADAQVEAKRSKLTPVRGPAQMPDRLDEAYAALHDKDIEKADEAFQWALNQKGENVDALVGLALVQMEKENFTKARSLLEQARTAAPNQPEKWQQALASATFWEQVRAAEKKAAAGDIDRALTMLEEAKSISPAEAVHADLSEASILYDADRKKEAADRYRSVLDQDPVNVQALQAMVSIMLQQGQSEAADVFNERLRKIDPKLAITGTRFQSEMLRSQAKFEHKIGDLEQARVLLQQARDIDPENVWVQFDLMNVDMELHRFDSARIIIDRLVTGHPEQAQFHLASARLYAEQGDPRKALEMINGARDLEMSPKIERFRKDLEMQIAADSAVRRAKASGKVSFGVQKLIELQKQTDGDPSELAIIALAFADLQEYDRAVAVMRSAMAISRNQSPTFQLQLAAVYLRGKRYPEFLDQISQLRTNPDLTARERQNLSDLRVAYAVTRSDSARDDRNFQTAFSYLAPLMKEYRENPKLMAALGRIFYSKGEYSEADAIFTRILEQDAFNTEAMEGSIFSKVRMRKTSEAKRLIKDGIEKYPNQSDIYLIAGRAYAMMGNDAAAMKNLRKALAIEETGGNSGIDSYSSLDSNGDSISSNSVYDEILVTASNTFAGHDTASDIGQPKTSRRSEIMQEIQLIKERYRSGVFVYPTVRYHAGDAGLSQLTDIYGDIGVTIPAGYRGHFNLTVTPEYLDAGTFKGTKYADAQRFGTIGATGEPIDKDERLTDAGVGLEIGYAYRGYKLFAGVSPLGYELFTPLGRIEIGDQFNAFAFRLVGHRELVRDSLLSMAGLVDPISDKTWGGITHNGGRLDLSVEKRPVLFYIFGGYDFLMGTEVQDNQAWQAGTGLLWTIYELDGNSFVSGISSSLMGYEYNQNFYTFGHGGYFSPQFFVNAGVPIRLNGKRGAVGYGLDAQVGLNWFQEDAADYYPTKKDLQTRREEIVALPDQYGQAVYEKNDGTLSFALDAGGKVSFDITEDFTAGLNAHVYTAEEYTEFIGQFRLDYAF